MSTLLGISGALRSGSTNTQLIRAAAKLYGATEFIEGDLRIPLYDGDREEADGIPDDVAKLSQQIAAADAVIISTPEYNKSIPGVLKNALDWVSRTEGSVWDNKPVAIMSAAAGRAGGERAQFALRLCMMPFRPRLLQGPEVLVAQSFQQFDKNGELSENYAKLLTELMADLRAMADAD